MNNKYKRILFGNDHDNDFWPSFTDMLATILLVVLLIFMVIIEKERAELAKTQAEFEHQKKQFEQQNKVVEHQKQVIEGMVGVKKDIIEKLVAKFDQTDLKIEIDKETGAIKFQNDLLFETNRSEIKPEFKKQLNSFIPAYFNILMGEYGEYVSEIVVEGHTDDRGSFNSNLILSQARSFSVVTYLLSDEFGNFPYKAEVRDEITANGRSESILKYKDDKNQVVDRDKSRRVEFKFRLNNEKEWENILMEINEK